MIEDVVDLRTAARARALTVEPPGALTAAVIATWRERMINEYRSSSVFDGLADQLAAIGLHDDAAQCRTFGGEERSHGIACGAVVEAAGGAASFTATRARELPIHADTSPRAGVIRNAISICCMSETVAVALIGAERLEMPDGPLRELLTKIWSDEIGHARFGWQLVTRELSNLDPSERAAVDSYLPVAFGALEAHELAHIPTATQWPPAASAYGLCDGGDARTLFYETVSEVIVPQLTAHGLAAEQGWQHRRTA